MVLRREKKACGAIVGLREKGGKEKELNPSFCKENKRRRFSFRAQCRVHKWGEKREKFAAKKKGKPP